MLPAYSTETYSTFSTKTYIWFHFAGELSSEDQFHTAETKLASLFYKHRIIWVGRDFKGHFIHLLCTEQGHLQLDHVAQSLVLPDTGCTQGLGIHHPRIQCAQRALFSELRMWSSTRCPDMSSSTLTFPSPETSHHATQPCSNVSQWYWTTQWYLTATDLLVLYSSCLSAQSALIYLHKCSSKYYHTPHSRNKHRAIKIKMLRTVSRFLLWTQALISFWEAERRKCPTTFQQPFHAACAPSHI